MIALQLVSAVIPFVLIFSEVSTVEDLEFEVLKKLEIERIKSLILNGLGLKEPPTLPETTSQLSEDVIEAIVQSEEEDLSPHQQDRVSNLMIFPTNQNFDCQWYDDPFCSRFEYKLSLDFASNTELFIHKTSCFSSQNLTITVLYSLSDEEIAKIERRQFSEKDVTEKWLIFDFPELENIPFKMDNLTCAFEITGMDIDEHSPNLPFLKTSQKSQPRILKREVDTAVNASATCRPIPFTINFKTIGWDKWIQYPHEFEARLCKGYCSNVQSNHENFVTLMFQRNETLERIYGNFTEAVCWATCCRPYEYSSKSVIHKVESGAITPVLYTKMVVESCSCG